MEVTIRGAPEEIAALVLAVQERQLDQKELASKLNKILLEQSEAHKDLQYN